jgi:hypothetical protein
MKRKAIIWGIIILAALAAIAKIVVDDIAGF